MKLKDVLALKVGDKIKHRRYGLCDVKEVMFSFGNLFGVIISPTTSEGRQLLAIDSQVTDVKDFLEDSIRRLQPA